MLEGEVKTLTQDRVSGGAVVNTGNGSSGSMKGCTFSDFPNEYLCLCIRIVVYVFLLLSMYYCCLCILIVVYVFLLLVYVFLSLSILIVVYVFLLFVYVFLSLSTYSYCCLCILIVSLCILIVVYVLSMYS